MAWFIKYLTLFIALLFIGFPQVSGQELTLKQAVKEAVAHNPDLLEAAHEVRARSAGIWDSISPPDPEFFLEYEGIPLSNHSLSEYGERKLGFSQEMAFPLVYFFRGKNSLSRKRDAQAEYNRLHNDVVSNVKKSFFRILLMEEEKHLYEDIVRLTRDNYRKARIRVQAGESSSYDTLKIKVDLTEAENQAMAINKEYRLSRSRLALILGRDPGDPPEISGDLSFSPVLFNLDTLKYLALINHPIVNRAEIQISQKKISRTLAWLGLMPSIKLSYFRHEFPGEPVPKAWGGEVGLSIPFWFFLKGQGSIRAASFELDASRYHLESQKRRVLLHVEEAYSQFIVAEKQVQLYQRSSLGEVEELVRIATRSYEEGEMGYLEVAEALRSLNKTKAGYAEALYEYLAAQVDLEKAVGLSTIVQN